MFLIESCSASVKEKKKFNSNLQLKNLRKRYDGGRSENFGWGQKFLGNKVSEQGSNTSK